MEHVVLRGLLCLPYRLGASGTARRAHLASGLAVLAIADSQPIPVVGWLSLGLGMGIGLYDTAFAEDAEPSETLNWSVETVDAQRP